MLADLERQQMREIERQRQLVLTLSSPARGKEGKRARGRVLNNKRVPERNTQEGTCRAQ